LGRKGEKNNETLKNHLPRRKTSRKELSPWLSQHQTDSAKELKEGKMENRLQRALQSEPALQPRTATNPTKEGGRRKRKGEQELPAVKIKPHQGVENEKF